ncbi:MAG TPA: type VI secretion system tube protein Hcp [Rhizomicrobium sp.]
MAEVDAFLKLDGIKGEAADAKHSGEIAVLKWDWSLTNTGSAHYGQGMGAGKVQIGDIHILKRVDTSSPILVKACTTGQHIASGKLTVRKSGGTALEYFKVDLTGILVSSVRPWSDPNNPVLMEDIALNFATFKLTYTPQDEKGAGGATVDFGYDIQKNKVT